MKLFHLDIIFNDCKFLDEMTYQATVGFKYPVCQKNG